MFPTSQHSSLRVYRIYIYYTQTDLLQSNQMFEHQIQYISVKRDEQLQFVRNIELITDTHNRTFYAQHVHYQSFENSTTHPIYINLIREPVARFISHFYFRRHSSGNGGIEDGFAFIAENQVPAMINEMFFFFTLSNHIFKKIF